MMRRFLRLEMTFILIILVSVFLLSGVSRAEENLQQYVENMEPGWNLGNTLDAPEGETTWGNPRTKKELIEKVADSGFNSIRIPVTWDKRIGSGPEYRINDDFMERVEQIVDWALEEDLYVILNMHHDSDWIKEMGNDYDKVLNRYSAVWEQIAEHFRDYPETVMFEAINEPRFSDAGLEQQDRPEYFVFLDDLQQTFHKIVRDSGATNETRPLVLTTMTGSSRENRIDELAETISELDDDRLIATFHFYGYWPFSVNVDGKTRFDERVKQDIVENFERGYEIFVQEGIPVIIGEFGLLGFDKSVSVIEHGEMLKFFEYATYYADKLGMPLMLWDNGQHLDRRSLQWRDKQLLNLVIAGTKNRSSYAENDFVFIKEGEEITDEKLKLKLHGNELVDVKAGEESLVQGTDFKLQDELLIIKAEYLKEVINDEYGVNETLVLEFSQGIDWKIDLIYYAPPEVKGEVKGSRKVYLPLKFRGDRLATMEAEYLDRSGNPGIHDWTPYLEFDREFKIKEGTIILSSDLTDNMKDGKILLTLHFWSGARIEYILQKEGNDYEGKLK